MTQIKIDKDFPLPESRTKYPFGDMEVGDSFWSDNSREAVSSSAYSYGQRHGMKFTVRITDGVTRCWRIK